jgi:hypothetical protein
MKSHPLSGQVAKGLFRQHQVPVGPSLERKAANQVVKRLLLQLVIHESNDHHVSKLVGSGSSRKGEFLARGGENLDCKSARDQPCRLAITFEKGTSSKPLRVMIDFNVPTGISRLLGTGTVAAVASGI